MVDNPLEEGYNLYALLGPRPVGRGQGRSSEAIEMEVIHGMLRNFGLPELVIVLLIVIVIFGVGRLGKIGAELGRGIRNFRQALSGEDVDFEEEESPEPEGA